jgi:8-oxo-dGTP pyrophosphatase MutT (NUDIX family)
MPPEFLERREPPARQQIPRPAGASRVDPPADWLELSDARSDVTTGAVRAAFAARPPSLRAPVEAPPGGTAAVLIAAVPGPDGGETSSASVVLIRRAAHLRMSPGEIGFPGGRIEPGEEPLTAALREAEEEVALRARAVEVVGGLSSFVRPRHLDMIIPFVAVAPERPRLEANPEEVDAILVVPLAELLVPGRYWQERWDDNGDRARVLHFFDLGEDVIWGATAWLLYAFFLRVLEGRDASRDEAGH